MSSKEPTPNEKLVQYLNIFLPRDIVAERKGLLIANVSRVLKESAIDCLLNRKGLDGSLFFVNFQ